MRQNKGKVIYSDTGISGKDKDFDVNLIAQLNVDTVLQMCYIRQKCIHFHHIYEKISHYKPNNCQYLQDEKKTPKQICAH